MRLGIIIHYTKASGEIGGDRKKLKRYNRKEEGELLTGKATL